MEIYNNILNFDELFSTNEYAYNLVKQGNIAEFTTIYAHNQTKGKGQQGNMWVSEKGKNITFSIILHPIQIIPSKQFILSQCVSLGIQKVLRNYCEHVTIKWPNDIYVNKKKIAGILIENILSGNKISSSIIGIGLNINQEKFDISIPNPTSLKICTGKFFDTQQILRECLLSIFEIYTSMPQNNTEIHDNYMKVLYKKGIKSKFQDNTGIFKGTIISVDETGKISIVDEQNNVRSYYFKEIEFK